MFSFFLAFALQFMVIHQYHIYSTLMKELLDPNNSAVKSYVDDFMAKYGTNYRTFKHGALHGTIGGLLIALPIVATNALFERKGFQYVAINAGFWIVNMALMGGIICACA